MFIVTTIVYDVEFELVILLRLTKELGMLTLELVVSA